MIKNCEKCGGAISITTDHKYRVGTLIWCCSVAASQEVERLRNCLERFVGMPNHFEEYGTAEEALTHNAELAKT